MGRPAGKPYESVKIYDEDYERVRQIRQQRGLSMVDAVGTAIESWSHVPRRLQDQIIRRRNSRKFVSESVTA